MKRYIGIMALVLALALLAGCKIVEVSPDPAQKIVLHPGESQSFSIAWIGTQETYWDFSGLPDSNWWPTESIAASTETTTMPTHRVGQIFTPTPDDIGQYTNSISVYDLVTCYWGGYAFPLCIWSDKRTWDVEVWGVKITPEQAFLVAPVQSETFQAVTCPQSAYAYTWRLDGNIVSNAADFTYAPTRANIGPHTLTVTAVSQKNSFSYEREIYVPYAFYDPSDPNQDASFVDIQPTTDGGHVLLGHLQKSTSTKTYTSAIVLKLDAGGNVVWQQEMPSDEYTATVTECILTTSDGGYILASHTTWDYQITKLDASGAFEWQKVFGHSWTTYKDDASFIRTADGGYLFWGRECDGSTFERNAVLFKLDAEGDIQWQQEYPDIMTWYVDACQTLDGGYLIALGDIMKIDAAGVMQWQISYPGETLIAIQPTPDGGFVTAGRDTTSSTSAIISKFDATGTLEWQKQQGADVGAYISDIQPAQDGGYLLIGCALSTGYRYGQYILKLDSTGEKVWQQCYPKRFWARDSYAIAYSLCQTPDGGGLVAGSFNDKACVFKLNAQGN